MPLLEFKLDINAFVVTLSLALVIEDQALSATIPAVEMETRCVEEGGRIMFIEQVTTEYNSFCWNLSLLNSNFFYFI